MQPDHVHNGEKIHPFVSIWFSTRNTTRYVLENRNLGYAVTLAAIAGIPLVLSAGSQYMEQYSFPIWIVIIGSLLLGPLYGLLSWGISTLLFTYIGKWIGGVGTLQGMGKAMGVVFIPAIWMTPFWILETAISFNEPSILNGTTGASATGLIWIVFSTLITLAYSIFMIVIQSRAIGEVHEFSSWKGFGTLVIPAAVTLGILFMISSIFLLIV
ncbi:YIP1 family protein [Paenisporosarcina sp. NPDC076898]|uniref:YIP1 family protein n=1 Tax=unclassified Paenisporosarcina TaxID=2642018 RepID=UPI003D01DC9F